MTAAQIDFVEQRRQHSSLGQVVKIMPGVVVTDDILQHAAQRLMPGERIGEALIRIGVLTTEQRDAALVIQRRLRAARSIDEVADLLDDITARCAQACDRALSALEAE